MAASSEETIKLLENIAIVIKNAVLSSEKKPSKEELIKILCKEFGGRLLRFSEKTLNKIVGVCIEQIKLDCLMGDIFEKSTTKDVSLAFQLRLWTFSQSTITKACEGMKKKVQESDLSSNTEFVDFLYDLLRVCFGDLWTDFKEELKEFVGDLKRLLVKKVDEYVSRELIPKLSGLILTKCNVSLDKQLRILKPYLVKGLKVFLKEKRIPNKKEIISMAKQSLPVFFFRVTNSALEKGLTSGALTDCIPTAITEILIPDESEETKKLLEDTIKAAREALFSSDSTLSVENLLMLTVDKFGDKLFCLCKHKLEEITDYLIETFPHQADAAMEFVIKHVLPQLSVQFYPFAYVLIEVFLKDSFKQILAKGEIKGRMFTKPIGLAAIKWCAEASKIGTQVSNEVIIKRVTKKTTEISLKITETVARETTGKSVHAFTQVAQNTAAKLSAKVTNDGTQVVATQVTKVTQKAAAKLSAKVTNDGTQIVAAQVTKVTQKTAAKLSAKVTNDGTQVVAAQVTKKAVKRTVTETVEGVTTTTTKKLTLKSTQVTKTSTKLSEKVSKEATSKGVQSAATAGFSAAGISALVGGFFLYGTIQSLTKQKEKGEITEQEYSKNKRECIGEYAGDVVGSGIVGAAVSIAALTGPVGWAAIGAGAVVSFGCGKLGGLIAQYV